MHVLMSLVIADSIELCEDVISYSQTNLLFKSRSKKISNNLIENFSRAALRNVIKEISFEQNSA